MIKSGESDAQNAYIMCFKTKHAENGDHPIAHAVLKNVPLINIKLVLFTRNVKEENKQGYLKVFKN